jgi:hypothetical protein
MVLERSYMKLQLSLLFLFAVLCIPGHAQEAVYLCKNKDGSQEYKNTGDIRGCRKIEMEGVTVVPAPKRVVQTAEAKRTAMPAPAAFPRIDGDKQKLLDEERRRILQEEMKAEEQKLMLLQKEYNKGAPARLASERNDVQYQARVALLEEDIHRAEKNIEALQRELGKLR